MKGLLARNTFWMLGGLGLKMITQAVYFVIITKALGSTNYGAFMTAVAFVAILAPFASLGSGNLMVRAVSRDAKRFPIYWGRAIVTTSLSASVLLILLSLVSMPILPNDVPRGLILLIATSDLYFARMIDVSGQAFQAFEQLRMTAFLQALPSAIKMGLAVALASTGAHSPKTWAASYLAATAVAALVSCVIVAVRLGRPQLMRPASEWEHKDGFFFAFSLSAQSIYNDVDKVILGRVANLDAVGIYAAGYRIIEVALSPLRSLLFATYSKFFQHGAGGMRSALNFAKRLLPVGIMYGLATAGGLFVFAPALARILGGGFSEVASAVRWLSLLPLMKLLSYLPADVLTGADRQWTRTKLQMAFAVWNAGLTIYLVSGHGWRGAAWASLITDGLLAATLWATVLFSAEHVSPQEKQGATL